MKATFLIFCICILPFVPGSETPAGEYPRPSDTAYTGRVEKTIEESGHVSIKKTGTYRLTCRDCTVMWQVEVHRAEQGQDMLLRTRRPVGVECDYRFADQRPLHRTVLAEIFRDWDKDRFKTLFLGPLERLEPAFTWNARIAMASADSADWLDWVRNYPHHKSGKSPNRIFVETANRVSAYRELQGLFREFGLRIRLESVEKVFAREAKELPFYDALKARGLKGNPRLMYDAGMNYFAIWVQEHEVK